MIRHLTTLFFFLLCTTMIFGQEVYRATVKYTPPGNGFELNIPFAWKFITCNGEVKVTIAKNNKAITSQAYIYNGVRYTAAELGRDVFLNPECGLTDVRADVYNSSYRLGTISMGNVIDWLGGCLGQTYWVTKMLGLSDEEYKEKLADLRLMNLSIEKSKSQSLTVEDQIKELLKDREIKDKLAEANQMLANDELENAKKVYEEVLDLDYSNQEAHDGIKTIKEKIKEKKEAEKNEKVEEETDSKNESSDHSENSSEETTSSSTNSNSNTTSNSDNTAEPDTALSAAEKQRLADIAEYQEMQRQTDANAEAAAVAATAFAIALYKIAGFIYSDLGNESGNPFSGDAPSARLHFGLGFHTSPIYNNTSRTNFKNPNGTWNTGGSAQPYRTNTIDFNYRFEVWPLRGKSYGVGLIGDGAIGTDLIFQNFKLEAVMGINTQIGVEKWMASFSLYRGIRNQFYRPWIVAGEEGDGGTVKQRYSRVAIGGIYSWKAYYNGLTRAHAKMEALFEHPRNSSAPMYLNQWARGISATFYFENRIKYFADVFPKYPRLGETTLRSPDDIKRNGAMIRFGASRCIDQNAHGSYARSSNRKTGLKSKFALFGSLNLSQLSKKEIEHDDEFINNFMAGAGLGFGFDRRITKHFGISTGIAASIRSFNIETRFNSFTLDTTTIISSTGTYIKYSETAVSIPLSLFYVNQTPAGNDFWLKGGLKINQAIRNKLYNGIYPRPRADGNGFPSDTEVEISDKRSRFNSSFVSFGMDYTVNGTSTMRCALEFERDRTSAFKSSVPTRFVTGRLIVGIIL